MILVDDRVGSAELLPLFPRGTAERRRLPDGDFAWVGWFDGRLVQVGVERKRLPDLLSSWAGGRLMGRQIPGLGALYDHAFLIVEGLWTVRDGMLVVPGARDKKMGRRLWVPVRSGFSAAQVVGMLTTLTVAGRIPWLRTSTAYETVWLLGRLHAWYQRREHRSHVRLDLPPETVQTWGRATVLMRVAACLPGIGPAKAAALGDAFGSVTGLVGASEAELAAVPGIGPVLAVRIRAQLEGRE